MREKVESFYNEFFDTRWERRILPFIWVLYHMVGMIIPYQDFASGDDISTFRLMMIFGAASPILYVASYISFNENQKQKKLYDKLKYHPVDMREVRKYRINRLIYYTARIFCVALFVQLVFTLFIHQEILWQNIVHAAVWGFLMPTAIGLPVAFFSK